MKVTVFGVRSVDFTSSDGRAISGATMYIGYEAEGVDGLATEKIFVSAGKLPKKAITPGQDVEIAFNMRGKVEKVEAVINNN